MIRCYHAGAEVPPHSFFILCKGCNAGKPGFHPWVNSFMVTCPHEAYFTFFFWLIYGLHQAGKFRTRHRGTAIQFINLEDVRDLLREVAPLIHPDWSKYQEILTTLEKLDKVKSNLFQQLSSTEELQRCLLHKYFEEIRRSST